MSTKYLCECGISSAHSISTAVRSGSHDSPPGCTLTALTWTQASLAVAASLVANLFRNIAYTVPTNGLMVQRSRYAALQLLPIIIERVPAELDKHLEDAFLTAHSHCTLALAVLVRSPKPCRYLAWRKRGAHLRMCAGDERILSKHWSSRHCGGCLPRTHPPALRPDRGRCAALPHATEASPLQHQMWLPGWYPIRRAACSTGTAGHVNELFLSELHGRVCASEHLREFAAKQRNVPHHSLWTRGVCWGSACSARRIEL